MRDILISESITGAAVDRLSARFNVVHLPELWKNPELLAERIRNASALIVRNQTRVTRDVLRGSCSLFRGRAPDSTISTSKPLPKPAFSSPMHRTRTPSAPPNTPWRCCSRWRIA